MVPFEEETPGRIRLGPKRPEKVKDPLETDSSDEDDFKPPEQPKPYPLKSSHIVATPGNFYADTDNE